ncbi:MAG: TIGR01212 family radical SAM protein [Prevotella sp.]|uniref:TIGR01212 family radical SAM protein n=1 Tax=Prevotella sp. TaxID=59823 RepID=UPI002A321D15|nr:TIGR01212 family radical SAM protein [Prevotella sp.]MDD7319180.1 TIGR01212 family radical SAM protein [Prevotellaceae bacterium]MDY4020048.1 TIGR01212 family radical SAM protein [Prevotella sp.]
MEKKHYNDFGSWIRERLGGKVQKISIDAGFSCPNRDGAKGVGGCIFCDNKTFSPSYCRGTKNVREQLTEGINFFKRKYNDVKYMAYFQSYTNTYASVEKLKRLYEEALNVENVVGIVIGTRPDCVPNTTLDYLEQLNRQVFMIVEYGIESVNNHTLAKIRRGHTFECSQDAIARTAERGILVGGHLILGLPGETREDNIKAAEEISKTRIDILKLHQLQVVKDTALADEYMKERFHVYDVDEYIELVASFIQHTRHDIVFDRFASQSPSDMVIAPKWGIKSHEFTDKLDNHLRLNEIFQGQLITD